MEKDKRLKRVDRMLWLNDTINKHFKENNNEPIDKRRLIAAFCMINNAPERAAKEMLNVLQYTDKIKIVGNTVYKGGVDEAERA